MIRTPTQANFHTVHEYGEIRYDALPACAPHRLEQLLRQLGNKNLFKLKHNCVKMRQFVGTFGCEDFTIEVLPKIDQCDDDEARCRRKLFEMLRVARKVDWKLTGAAAQLEQSASLLDYFAAVYVQQLAVEWRRGRVANYVPRDRNRKCLKGKLLISKNIRHNLLRRERFFTRHNEFLADSPLTQTLKAALTLCENWTRSGSVKRDAHTLLEEFHEVPDVPPSHLVLDSITTTRQTERFSPVLELAKLLLGESLADRQGHRRTFCLVFDMNQVFEDYIGQLFKRICPMARLQHSTHSLLRNAAGQKRFGLKPDIVVAADDESPDVIDTKWKVLDKDGGGLKVSQSDVYQMYAYAKEYEARRTTLLYPHSSRLPKEQGVQREYTFQDGTPLQIATVDIMQTPQEVVEQLRKLQSPNLLLPE